MKYRVNDIVTLNRTITTPMIIIPVYSKMKITYVDKLFHSLDLVSIRDPRIWVQDVKLSEII